MASKPADRVVGKATTPYRAGDGGERCPACSGPSLSREPHEPMACAKGCGRWFPTDVLVRWIDPVVLTTSARAWWKHGQPLPCPACGAAMQVVGRDAATAERCNEHGLWLASARRKAFEGEFARELKARDGWVPPAPASTRRKPPRDLDVLEARVAALEARLATAEHELAELRGPRRR